MPTRIETIRLRLTTGERGHDDPVHIRFNGFDLALNRISGGTAPGESYEGEFFLGSVAHGCSLVGPLTGAWDLKEIVVEYDHGHGEATRHHFGARTLATGQELDLLSPPPARPFDV